VRLRFAALLVAVACSVRAVEVEKGIQDYAPPSGGVAGNLPITSTPDLKGVVEEWVRTLVAANPGVHPTLDFPGSPVAVRALATGRARVAVLGRPMLDEEAAEVKRAWGRPPRMVEACESTFADRDKTHAEAVWVARDNPLKAINLMQLDAIFGAERRRGGGAAIETWGQLGLSGVWADKPVHPIAFNSSVGAKDYLRRRVLRGGTWRPAVTFIAKDEDVVTQGVARDRLAIGLTGAGFGAGTAARTVPVAEDEAGPAVAATPETVASRAYPLYRVVAIYWREGDAVTREFLRVVLSRQGQEAALRETYLPLPEEIATKQLRSLK
jgi:phosphate transport system substrate-binding protein